MKCLGSNKKRGLLLFRHILSKNTRTEIISQFMYLAAINDSCLSPEPPDCEKKLSILRKLFKYLCLDTRTKYFARRNTIDNWTYKKPFCVDDFFFKS